MSQYCACGNSKYDDADQCEECYAYGSSYDYSVPAPTYRCTCGELKEAADATECRKCYNKKRTTDG